MCTQDRSAACGISERIAPLPLLGTVTLLASARTSSDLDTRRCLLSGRRRKRQFFICLQPVDDMSGHAHKVTLGPTPDTGSTAFATAGIPERRLRP